MPIRVRVMALIGTDTLIGIGTGIDTGTGTGKGTGIGTDTLIGADSLIGIGRYNTAPSRHNDTEARSTMSVTIRHGIQHVTSNESPSWTHTQWGCR